MAKWSETFKRPFWCHWGQRQDGLEGILGQQISHAGPISFQTPFNSQHPPVSQCSTSTVQSALSSASSIHISCSPIGCANMPCTAYISTVYWRPLSAGWCYLFVHGEAVPFDAKERFRADEPKLQSILDWLQMVIAALDQGGPSSLGPHNAVQAVVGFLKLAGVGDDCLGLS